MENSDQMTGGKMGRHYNGERHDHGGHDHSSHHRMMIRDFRKRFFVSLGLTIPILVLSPTVQGILGYAFTFPFSSYLLFALASAIFIYGGWPFLKGLVDELRRKQPGMMTLIALAVSVAYIYSSAVVFGLKGKYFFWELATLIDVMLVGHWIEMRSILGASRALEELAKLMPDTAHRLRDGEVEDVPQQELAKGEMVLVKPGEKIPVDGIIRMGSSYLNQAMLTGESKPVEKQEGDRVIGGSLNGDGSLEVEVEGTGEESYLSRVIGMVRESQAAKSRTQALSDRAAFWLTLIAITVGITTLVVWLALGRNIQFSIERMATVMVITCPHALGLAIPLVVAVSTSLSARNGLLIRNRTAFENARRITTVLFDKTGTLTRGIFEVTAIEPLGGGMSRERMIALAASLEQNSEHPIAGGIVDKAQEMGVELKVVSEFEAMKGRGVRGVVDGQEVRVVSPGYLEEKQIEAPQEGRRDGSATRVYLLVDQEVAGSITLSDVIREESYQAVRRLQDRGIRCWMITGDNEKTAEAVAQELGMDGFFAEVLPEQKQDKVRELQEQGEYVAMTGDGVNDAPALAAAQIGIAVGSGTDVAAETADIVLVNSNPLDVTSLILFGRATYRKMVQNLIWATGYNVIAIPLAAGVLYGAGIVISPAVGALLMSASTVIVAINARLLKLRKGSGGDDG
jgi:Cu2+-exporting ATPase